MGGESGLLQPAINMRCSLSDGRVVPGERKSQRELGRRCRTRGPTCRQEAVLGRHDQGCSWGILPGIMSIQLVQEQRAAHALDPAGGVNPQVRRQGDSNVLSIAPRQGRIGLARGMEKLFANSSISIHTLTLRWPHCQTDPSMATTPLLWAKPWRVATRSGVRS